MSPREYLSALAGTLLLMAMAVGTLLLLHALAAFELGRWFFSLPMRLYGTKRAPARREAP